MLLLENRFHSGFEGTNCRNCTKFFTFTVQFGCKCVKNVLGIPLANHEQVVIRVFEGERGYRANVFNSTFKLNVIFEQEGIRFLNIGRPEKA